MEFAGCADTRTARSRGSGFDFGPRGPLVEPGKYTVKIKAGSKEGTQEVVVEDDPRMQMPPADRAARREAIEQLYAMAKTLDKDRKAIEGIKEGLKTAREQWKKDADKPDAPKIPAEIQKAAEELQKKVDTAAEKYVREREGLGNAGPPFEWKPEPLPQQVQGLLRDLDGFWAASGRTTKGQAGGNCRHSSTMRRHRLRKLWKRTRSGAEQEDE